MLINYGGWSLIQCSKECLGAAIRDGLDKYEKIQIGHAEIDREGLLCLSSVVSRCAVGQISTRMLIVNAIKYKDALHKLEFIAPFPDEKGQKRANAMDLNGEKSTRSKMVLSHYVTEGQRVQDQIDQHGRDREASKQAVRLAELVKAVDLQKIRLHGAVFEDIRIQTGSATVTFSGGLKLTFVLHERQNRRDEYENSSFGVTIEKDE